MKLAAPLFILREKCAVDLQGVIEELAGIGYEGIEFLGFFGHSGKEVGGWLREAGLAAVGDHVPYRDFVAEGSRVLEEHAEAGCEYITIAEFPMERFDEVERRLPEISQQAARMGMRLLYHNHSDELKERIDGEEKLWWLMERIPESVLELEPDLGWMEIAGADCRRYLRAFRDRSPVLHLKDFCRAEESGEVLFRPTGYGIMNYGVLWPLCMQCRPQWLVLDHDKSYTGNEFGELRMALKYVTNLRKLAGD